MDAAKPALVPPMIGTPGRVPLTVQVAQDLQARIARGELRPGDQLPTERELMARYGVSRTVVREAVSTLRAGGLLSTRQGRGAFLLAPPEPPPARLDASEIGPLRDAVKLMEIRVSLEAEAAFLAAQRRTPGGLAELDTAARAFGHSVETPEGSNAHDQAFHLCIARLSGNEYFAALLSGLSPSLLPRARVDLFRGDRAATVAYLRRLEAEHARIRDAVARGDAEGARAAMRLHLTSSQERLSAVLKATAG